MKKQSPIKTNDTYRQRTRLSRETRREQLVECALDAFASNGILRATHADIAELAQVSVPAVFSYFSNRDALVDEVLNQVEHFFRQTVLSAANDSSSNARSRLINMVISCVDTIDSHPNYNFVLISWGAAIKDSKWIRFVQFCDDITSIFEKVISEGKKDKSVPKKLNVREAATMIVGEAHMISMMAFSGIKRDRIEQFAEHYIDAAINFANVSTISHKDTSR